MKHISLFSGIGGFDLAAEWVGWENLASCEIADFPRKVLQYHFPKSYHHDDIHTLNYEKLDYELKKRFGDQWRSDDIVLSGGFPCQPYSIAGKRLGKNDSRHLWPEMLRVIREIKPTWVVGENVRGLISWNAGLVFDEVQSDLEAEGYCVQAFVLPAAGLNAPHRRDRVWFVAYSGGTRTGDKGREFNGQGRESGSNRKPSIYENGAVGASGHNTASANDGITKNTNHDGWGSEFGQKESSERQFGNTCSGNNEPISSNDAEIRLTPDPNSERHEECDTSSITIQQRRQQYSEKYSASAAGHWENFPTTEPTIRGGDDGIFTKSHGITISENRNNMDRNLVTKLCLEEGRLKVDFKTGKIYSLKQRGCEGESIELKGSDCNGYIVHGIRYNGFKIQLRAHQIVWIAANGIYDKSSFMIDHINRNKKDNRLENLRLVDAKGNAENATRYSGKLTQDQKDLMVWLHKEDGIPIRELAEDFEISKSRVHQIISEHSGIYGITFSKWRNESIKAYGNAVVPQVVLMIFKAIEEYRNKNQF